MEEKKTVPFNGTKEQEQQLQAVIAEHKGQDGAAIPVLHKAQEIYGYLPIEVQTMIAEGLDIPLATLIDELAKDLGEDFSLSDIK